MSVSVKVPATECDVSTPMNVVASAYDTSGNGGRKLVRLDNGEIIFAMRDGATAYRLYKRATDGTMSLLVTVTETVGDVAIAKAGTYIYALSSYSTSGVKLRKYDSSGNLQGSAVNVDSSQTAMGSCSIACHTDGTLHAAWASKNSTYPNSFNIRYSKSTDGGVTWAAVTQVGAVNTTGINVNTPCIVINSSGNPVIVCTYNSSASNYCTRYVWTGSTWDASQSIYNGATYAQSNPCATVAPDGTIHVVWHGIDSTDTTKYNIRYSKSTDNGATWSTPVKLTSGNTYDQKHASIASDSVGNLYVRWYGTHSGSTTYNQIRSIVYSSGAWGSITNITSATGHQYYPQLCDNYNNFTEPLCVWQDNATPSVKFSGVWTEGGWTSGTAYVKVSGVWKEAVSTSIKVAGTWETV